MFLYPFYPDSCCQQTPGCRKPDRPTSRYSNTRRHCYYRTAQSTGNAYAGIEVCPVRASPRTGPGTLTGLHPVRLAALG